MTAHVTADDLLFFADEAQDAGADEPAPRTLPPWRILVVDDDPEIQAVTRLSLRGFRFEGRATEILSALSAAAARDILATTSDIALILLDVVMETDDAGLRLVRHIREDLGNQAVRIILRTGQPGLAPEERVVIEYDINDYRAKTELTYNRLALCTISALRSYRDIVAVKTSNLALSRIAESAVDMFRTSALHPLLDTMLTRLALVVGGTRGAALYAQQVDSHGGAGETTLVSGFGRFVNDIGKPPAQTLSTHECAAVDGAISDHRHRFTPSHIVLALHMRDRWSGAALIPVPNALSETLERLIEVFVTIITAALDNVYLMDELRRSNRATVVALADLAENRDTDTGEHVLRVARLTTEIGRELLRRDHPEVADALYVEQAGLAAMLHDLGKVGIPDGILKKTGRLTPEERAVMETHTTLGGKTLEKAKQVVPVSSYLNLGWEIATGHHEAFNGSGYPKGLKETEIPMSARIVAIADVYDALTSSRSYKPAWTAHDAIAYIVERGSVQFDPAVVEAFLAVITNRATRPYITWTPAMSVGVPRLDADHQQLIALINQLAAADKNTDRASIEFVLDELIQYTLLHFTREEKLLEQIHYSDLAEHRAAHAVLANRVLAFRTQFFNGLSTRLNEEILDFLSTWLKIHILEEDHKYAVLLSEHLSPML